jgi:hypothetical protein
MSEATVKVKTAAIVAAVALAAGLAAGIFIPAAWRAPILGGGGLGVLAVLAGILKKKGAVAPGETNAPKSKTDILADDPQHSLDRLPDAARADLDAKINADADARVDAIVKRHQGDGHPST